MANEATLNEVNASYASLRKKYRRSSYGFIVLTITTFAVVALTLILSIWAVKVSNTDARNYFIAIAVISAVIAFLNGLISTFTFGQVARRAKTKIAIIEKEEKTYHDNEGEYTVITNTKAKFEAYIRRLTIIFNE